MSLADALNDIKTELLAGSDASIIAEIAEEYGFKAAAVRTRFEQEYGDPATFAARRASTAARDPMTEALEAAEAEAARFVGGKHPIFGKVFHYDGEKFIAVVLSANHPKYFLRAVRVSDGAPWGFNRPVYEKKVAPLLRMAA